MDFNKIIEDNNIVQSALRGETINADLYSWLGGDILKLSYIKFDLKKGKSIREVAKFYGVTKYGIKKYCRI